MTTEMQEIAITEDKPLLTGQADPAKVRDGFHEPVQIKVHSCCAHARFQAPNVKLTYMLI